MFHNPSPRKRSAAVLFFLTATVLMTLLLVNRARPISGAQSSVPQQESRQTLSNSVSQNRPTKPPKTRRSILTLDSEETWDLNLQGTPCSIKLALDQAILRDADGKDTLITLTPPASQETLPARLALLESPGGVFPVAYLVGEERSIASRRLITPDLRVQLDANQANQIANQNQLAIKEWPSYAPGWVIMTAKSPFAALDAMVDLRSTTQVASADVLLATQFTLRALPNDPLAATQWHLNPVAVSPVVAGSDVKIDAIWNYPSTVGIRGSGVRIGVVDDGLQTSHPDFVSNIDTTNDKDWNGNDADPSPGTGDDHGTACAGNAAAQGNNGIGVTGTAPEATLVGMRLIAAAVTDAQEGEAMNYLSDLIQIKSNSWGPNDTGTTLEAPGPLTIAALQTAATTGRGGKGSIILWAGGNGGDVNDNSNYDGYANSIYTIAIGATDSKGTRANYSEPGANIVVTAPSSGNGTALGITTVDRTGANGYDSSDYTNSFGGTSSATPTAAGIVALMLEKNSNLGWRDVQEILIKSATKFKPADAGWVTNGAGIPFNHDFGAGLINATSAVNLAATWTNLPAQTSAISTQTGLTAAIPDNLAAGVTRTFNLAATNLRVEHVTLKLSATHTARGNLQITLTSPSGMSSTLAAVRPDINDNYSNWTFSSVRNWGENSAGTWTLKVADLSSTSNPSGGTLTAAELQVFGSSATPVNPAPLVQITAPTDGQVFSIGTPVNVTVNASDLNISGSTGTISRVELFDNEVSVGTDTTAPYSFTLSPVVGNHLFIARATDSEGAVGSSVSVAISVTNQSPVITAAALSATGFNNTNIPLTVTSVTATDPEGTALSYRYQWQASTNVTLFTDVPNATSATAPTLPGNLYRCVITASDGVSDSLSFTTAAVNALSPPITSAVVGSPYTYTSGLVLNGSESSLTRQAIIHEFSQGPSGGTSDWVEILTLKAGSLAYWDLSDDAGNLLVFKDDAVWDDIPAGTLIVIYNGASKDPLLAADDLDPGDGKMIISSTNATYFDVTHDSWIPLGNSGDSIFLNDALGDPVHSVAYGNSTTTTPNVGSVNGGKSAYYAGDTDAGADQAANWKVTTSLTARSLRALLPGVTLSGGTYTQNFNTIPGATGTAYPDGWTSYNDTVADAAMTAGSSTSTTGANYNYGSRIGLLGSGSSFNPSSLVLALANTTGVTGMNISFDVVKIREEARSISFKLQYSTTSATTGFDDVPGAAYTSAAIAAGTSTSFSAIQLPAAIENSSSTVYLRWLYATATGVGSRDGLALDNVIISKATATPALNLSITPTTFAENLGASAATGIVSISAALASPLVVTLGSSDTSEATVPATVTIAAGQTSSPTFAIAAIDDLDSDGSQQVTLTATASGYVNGSNTLTVTDNEPAAEGVTPAAANNPANQVFVTSLRNGSLDTPALFRFGSGGVTPAGLSLNALTGVLSGTIQTTNSIGNYLIVIERYNSLGGTTSQTFTLTLNGGSTNGFDTWATNFSIAPLNLMNDDPDADGIPNGVENLLGSNPGASSTGLVTVQSGPNTLKFRHTLSNNPATDLTASYEWSIDLESWHLSTESVSGRSINLTTAVLEDVAAPANDLVEVTATLTAPDRSKFFVRLKSEQKP
jgi:subtilisin-like proprotein convertase family protein